MLLNFIKILIGLLFVVILAYANWCVYSNKFNLNNLSTITINPLQATNSKNNVLIDTSSLLLPSKTKTPTLAILKTIDSLPKTNKSKKAPLNTKAPPADTIKIQSIIQNYSPIDSLENTLTKAGLVNIQSIDESIAVNLAYSGTDNFMKTNVYGNLKNAYLQPQVAKMLSKAQEYLKEKYPDLTLLVLDAARPNSVQKLMWEIVKNTPQQRYVAPAGSGSMHNYGAAIDLTIADKAGKHIDMGTPFDFFGDLAQPRYETKFKANNKLTNTQLNNRQLLRTVMKAAGFNMIMTEWWHFEAGSHETIKAKYKIIP